MTATDPFTTAAVERANEQYGTPGNREVFLDAAEWARSYLAAQESSDAEKDAVMEALGCGLRSLPNGQTTCDVHGRRASAEDVCWAVDAALSAARNARGGTT